MTPWVKRLLIANVGGLSAAAGLSGADVDACVRSGARAFDAVESPHVHVDPWGLLAYPVQHDRPLLLRPPRGSAHGLESIPRAVPRLRVSLAHSHSCLRRTSRSSALPARCSGVELAYARYWPLDRVYIDGLLPIQVRWLLVITVVMSIFGLGGIRSPGVAHLAHLGGSRGRRRLSLRDRAHALAPLAKSGAVRAEVRQAPRPAQRRHRRRATIPRSELHEINRSGGRPPARQDQLERDSTA